jgi:hypothetical protein
MSLPRTLPGFAIAILLALPLGAGAADEPPAVLVDFSYASRSIFRGVERAGASAQAAVEFNREQFSGGVWASRPFARDGTGEVNLHAAYTWQPVAQATLAASLSQVWLDHVAGDEVKQSCEAGLTATLAAVHGFTPSLAYYHDFRLRSDTAQVGLAHSLALTQLGAFLELEAFAGWAEGTNWRPDAPGARRRDGYGYWGGAARLPYRVGLHSTVTAGLHYADSFGRSTINGPFGRVSAGNLWFTLAVNLDF